MGKVADLMGLLDATSLQAFYGEPGSWLSTETIRSAVVRILEAAGVPFEPVIAGGQLRALRIGHVWVEAFLAYGDYRGAGREGGGRQWVAVDPAIPGGPKHEVVPSALDVAAILPGGIDGLIEEYLASPSSISPLQLFRSRATEELSNRGFTYEDGQRRIRAHRENLSLIPGALPYKVSVRRSAPRSPDARVAEVVQGRPPEATHGQADEEAGTQVGLAAVDSGGGAAGRGGVEGERVAARDVRAPTRAVRRADPVVETAAG